MVASKRPGPAAQRLSALQAVHPRRAGAATASRSMRVIQGALSGQRSRHRHPWLLSLHRTADGTLAGLGLCMLGLSGLTFHWQNQWALSFQKLEAAQVLEHRLQESAAQLERHHLRAVGRPGQLVPTSSDKLIFVPPPPRQRTSRPADRLLESLSWHQVPAGY